MLVLTSKQVFDSEPDVLTGGLRVDQRQHCDERFRKLGGAKCSRGP
jgi:hypothetical protein